MFVEIVRMFIVVLATLGGDALGRGSGGLSPEIGAMVGCLAGYVGGGMLGRVLERALGLVERRVERLPAPQFLAAVGGAGLGGFAGAVLGAPAVALLPRNTGWPIGGMLVFVAGWLGLRVAVRKSEELFALAGLSTRPLVRASAYGTGDGFVVDTSAIMDGQLLPLLRAGLLDGDLLLPCFVLDELRGLADGSDARARRARTGLESLEAIRNSGVGRVRVLDDELPEFSDVDTKVVALAKRLQIRVLTTDVHLARTANIQGVPATNLRQLATELWPARRPGETISVELVRPGREPGQGVGYLEDGSMVVVAGGADLVGRGAVPVSVTSVVPTAVGRMVFATPTPE